MTIEITSDGSRALLSEIGSHLVSLQLDGVDILLPSYDDSPTHYGSAFLFPYANRVRNAEYVLDGRNYSLPRNEGKNSIHGLVLGQRLAVTTSKDDSLTMEANIQAGVGYPSDLKVRISHSITSKSYSCQISVSNVGDRRSPVAAGFHPYFLFKDRWRIVEPETAWLMEYDGPFPTGKMDRITFDDDSYKKEYDNQFFADSDIVLDTGYARLKISRQAMPFFVIYNGKYSAGISVAVEPMMSAVDAFNNGIGLRLVNPGDTLAFGYSIGLMQY
ncbi:aldose 1-epimerase [Thermoplasma sp.]|uniref:aldose 1-epimerase n=1 Tax=Thermoplasma sp. TaxID=1973142 RepID=UPI0012896477|nr:aldose 1-epimerase [Thermoplasma sp.]KAA8923153.1 MAG: aldose 1-epimerase [Thermoplasma sp.]